MADNTEDPNNPKKKKKKPQDDDFGRAFAGLFKGNGSPDDLQTIIEAIMAAIAKSKGEEKAATAEAFERAEEEQEEPAAPPRSETYVDYSYLDQRYDKEKVKTAGFSLTETYNGVSLPEKLRRHIREDRKNYTLKQCDTVRKSIQFLDNRKYKILEGLFDEEGAFTKTANLTKDLLALDRKFMGGQVSQTETLTRLEDFQTNHAALSAEITARHDDLIATLDQMMQRLDYDSKNREIWKNAIEPYTRPDGSVITVFWLDPIAKITKVQAKTMRAYLDHQKQYIWKIREEQIEAARLYQERLDKMKKAVRDNYKEARASGFSWDHEFALLNSSDKTQKATNAILNAIDKRRYGTKRVEQRDMLVRGLEEGYFNPHERLIPVDRSGEVGENSEKFTWDFINWWEDGHKRAVADPTDMACALMTLYEVGREEEALRAARFLGYSQGASGQGKYGSHGRGDAFLEASLTELKTKSYVSSAHANGLKGDMSDDPHFKAFYDKLWDVQNTGKKSAASDPWEQRHKDRIYAGLDGPWKILNHLRYARLHAGGQLLSKPFKELFTSHGKNAIRLLLGGGVWGTNKEGEKEYKYSCFGIGHIHNAFNTLKRVKEKPWTVLAWPVSLAWNLTAASLYSTYMGITWGAKAYRAGKKSAVKYGILKDKDPIKTPSRIRLFKEENKETHKDFYFNTRYDVLEENKPMAPVM